MSGGGLGAEGAAEAASAAALAPESPGRRGGPAPAGPAPPGLLLGLGRQLEVRCALVQPRVLLPATHEHGGGHAASHRAGWPQRPREDDRTDHRRVHPDLPLGLASEGRLDRSRTASQAHRFPVFQRDSLQ